MFLLSLILVREHLQHVLKDPFVLSVTRFYETKKWEELHSLEHWLDSEGETDRPQTWFKGSAGFRVFIILVC